MSRVERTRMSDLRHPSAGRVVNPTLLEVAADTAQNAGEVAVDVEGAGESEDPGDLSGRLVVLKAEGKQETVSGREALQSGVESSREVTPKELLVGGLVGLRGQRGGVDRLDDQVL